MLTTVNAFLVYMLFPSPSPDMASPTVFMLRHRDDNITVHHK